MLQVRVFSDCYATVLILVIELKHTFKVIRQAVIPLNCMKRSHKIFHHCHETCTLLLEINKSICDDLNFQAAGDERSFISYESIYLLLYMSFSSDK